jgi:Zn-dependent peptidase ImmA (M78 family)
MWQRVAAFALYFVLMASQAWSATWPGESSASAVVLGFFEGHADETIDGFLAHIRPEPLTAAARARVLASFPPYGILRPSPTESAKIAAAERVLDYSARSGVITIRVIDLDHAFVGLYFRTVILVSRQALASVDREEFSGLVAHELGHDYDWNDYWTAMQSHNHLRMQQLELRADAIAVLILRRLRIAADRLLTAVAKVTRYNERLGALATAGDYVPLKERLAFIRAMKNLAWADTEIEGLPLHESACDGGRLVTAKESCRAIAMGKHMAAEVEEGQVARQITGSSEAVNSQHVRSDEASIRALVHKGYLRSSTFKALIDRIETMSCIVYVRHDVNLPSNIEGAMSTRVVGRRDLPILRIVLNANLGGDRAVAILAHELQHVVEAANEDLSSSQSIVELFRALDVDASVDTKMFDTGAARLVTERVLDELHRHR